MRSLKNGRNILYLFCRLGRPVHACWIHSHSILLMALQFCQEKHVLTDSPTIHSTLRASNMAMGNTFNKGFNWKKHIYRASMFHLLNVLDYAGFVGSSAIRCLATRNPLVCVIFLALPLGDVVLFSPNIEDCYPLAIKRGTIEHPPFSSMMLLIYLQLRGTSHFHVAGYFIPLVPNNLTIGVL